MRPRTTHSGTHIPKPLSAMQLDVLRFGAVSSGPAGLSWTVNGRRCSEAVRSLIKRGLVRTTNVVVHGHLALMTVTNRDGVTELEKAEAMPKPKAKRKPKPKPPAPPGPLKCPRCAARFHHKTKLKAHYARKHMETPT